MEPEIVTNRIIVNLCACVQRRMGYEAGKVIDVELHVAVGKPSEVYYKFTNALVVEGHCEEDVECESGRKEQ